VAAGAARAQIPAPSDEYQLGRQLFAGTLDLRGRIVTHVVDLPPGVIRCGNCHAGPTGPEVARSLAPRLTHDLLLAPRSRRGGPPSIYDRGKFCRLLRDGLDPASVMVSVEMPRYTLDDESCHALWRFLTGGSALEASRQ
jgi:hypothetical protein